MYSNMLLWLVAAASLVSANAVFAAGNTYQVTGTVMAVIPGKVVVQKGKERWEFDLSPEAKELAGKLKPGEKITITYTMTATSIAGHGEPSSKNAVESHKIRGQK